MNFQEKILPVQQTVAISQTSFVYFHLNTTTQSITHAQEQMSMNMSMNRGVPQKQLEEITSVEIGELVTQTVVCILSIS